MWKFVDIRTGVTEGGRYSELHGGCHFIRRADDKILVTYNSRPTRENAHIMLSTVENLSTLFYTPDASKPNEYSFYDVGVSSNANLSYFCKVPNIDPQQPDSVLLFIFEPDFWVKDRVRCYRSLNGLGDDFQLLSIISSPNDFGGPKLVGPGNAGCLPLYLDDVGDHGRIIVPFVKDRTTYDGYTITDACFAYSDNLGASWIIPDMPRGGTTLIGHRLSRVPGLAVFGELGNRQLVGAFSNGYGQGYVRYTMSQDDGLTWSRLSGSVCSECGGAGCGDCAGADIPAMPSQRNYLYIGSLSGHIWHYNTRPYNGHEIDEYNYMLSTFVSNDQSHPSRWWLYRRPKDSLLSTDEKPNVADGGWEGPLHPDQKGDDAREVYWGIIGDFFATQRIHVAGGGSTFSGGTISYCYQAGNFKFAIAGIYDDVIRSTFPFITMLIVYAVDLTSADNIHFILKSSVEEISTEDPEDRERFGYSMDGGNKWIKFPEAGIPAVNPYNILVAANIEVRPGTSATLTPYTKIIAGVGEETDWWKLSFDKTTPEWTYLGLEEGEEPEEWEPKFEHEVSGLPEEEEEE